MKRAHPHRWQWLPLAIGLVCLTACQSPSDSESETEQTAAVAGDGEVLVRVEGESITAYDLELAANRLLGPEQAAMLDDGGRRKLLESLVLSRLMARAAAKELSAEDAAKLDKQVAAYREQLLAKQYLKAHAVPGPVTDEMVKRYYEEHPEQFGGGRERHYRLLMATPDAVTGRETAMQVLKDAQDRDDWPDYVRAMSAKGHKLQLREGVVDAGLLHPQLLALLNQTAVNSVSAVTFIDGQAYVARIDKEVEKQPRPLAEVSAEIRRALVPVQLKKAIEQVGDGLRKSAQIDYASDAKQNDDKTKNDN